MSDNGQRVPLPGCMIGPSEPCDAFQRQTARIAELEAALQAGRDLMAVVHCDGGHYREAHGDRKAADDAIAIVSKLRVDLDAERERREAAEWALKEIRLHLHAAGRRPEECWEMSEIDGHFAQFSRLVRTLSD